MKNLLGKIKNSTKAKLLMFVVKLTVFLFSVLEYAIFLDFISRLNIKNDSMFFASCMFALIFVMMSIKLIWMLYVRDIYITIKKAYFRYANMEDESKRNLHIKQQQKQEEKLQQEKSKEMLRELYDDLERDKL